MHNVYDQIAHLSTAVTLHPGDLTATGTPSGVGFAIGRTIWGGPLSAYVSGDADPLLLSVRSGGPVSMPGMMDTVLNLGLTDDIVASAIGRGADGRAMKDSYRRLLTMYGDVVLGVAHRGFEKILRQAREAEGVDNDFELSEGALDRVIDEMKQLIEREHGSPFPQDPRAQLWGGINAVFDSWDNKRARDYRRLHGLPDDMGTGVNVQTMVFGNRGNDCATGVAFSRNPATGEQGIYGEYLPNAQGEDVVAGIRTPKDIHPAAGHGGLGADYPQAFETLKQVCERLERHYQEQLTKGLGDRDYELAPRHFDSGGDFSLAVRAGLHDNQLSILLEVEDPRHEAHQPGGAARVVMGKDRRPASRRRVPDA
mgnify:CR=1 FL=1